MKKEVLDKNICLCQKSSTGVRSLLLNASYRATFLLTQKFASIHQCFLMWTCVYSDASFFPSHTTKSNSSKTTMVKIVYNLIYPKFIRVPLFIPCIFMDNCPQKVSTRTNISRNNILASKIIFVAICILGHHV